jgi:DNA invertase Pin-like site-specific DNA recombinase
MSRKKNKIIPQGPVYGYLRVSTEEQNIDNNKNVIEKKKEELNLKGPITWIEEKISGTIYWKKRELGKWFDNANPGDVIMLSELSRISRKALEIQEFISVALEKKIKIYSLDMQIPIDGSPMSSMLINGIAIGAQIERDNISTRTKIALDKLKADGVKLGRPKGSKNEVTKLGPFKTQIGTMISAGITLKRIASDYKVSQQTMSKFVAENNLKPIRT